MQCQHELSVTDWGWGILAVLIGGHNFRMIPFERNADFISAMVRSEKAFWRCVETKSPPEADDSVSTTDTLKKLYPQDTGEEITLPAEACLWDRQLCEEKANRKECETTIRGLENKIRDALGTASVGKLSDGSGAYTWLAQERKAYEVSATTLRVLRRAKV